MLHDRSCIAKVYSNDICSPNSGAPADIQNELLWRDTAGNVIQVSLPQIKCHSEVQASLTRVSDLCLCLSEAQHLCTDTCLCNAISQAHGGSILYHNNIYYFYGENKGGRTLQPGT